MHVYHPEVFNQPRGAHKETKAHDCSRAEELGEAPKKKKKKSQKAVVVAKEKRTTKVCHIKCKIGMQCSHRQTLPCPKKPNPKPPLLPQTVAVSCSNGCCTGKAAAVLDKGIFWGTYTRCK